MERVLGTHCAELVITNARVRVKGLARRIAAWKKARAPNKSASRLLRLEALA